MIPNTNDGTSQAPYLRCDLSAGNLFGLPPESSGPHGDERVLVAAAKAAGFMGIQGVAPKLCAEFGLGATAGGRVNKPGEADGIAAKLKDEGYACVTLHVGSGFEDDAEMFAVAEDIIRASERRQFPIYIETHRATLTTDIWRTIQLAKRLPEIRFNGDFSHWYTGHEMVYGDLPKKFELIEPVFQRVRYIHGRIGNPGSMQVDVGDGKNLTYVDHFKEMWTRSFTGFLKSAKPGDYICFAPELLASNIYYARLIKNQQGELKEEGDRWQQALLYTHLAKECFEAAKKRL